MGDVKYGWLLPGAVFGWLLGGLAGAALGIVGVRTAVDERRWVYQVVVWVGTLLLFVAAGATILEASIDTADLGSSFASDRELASLSARLAAILAFCLLVGTAVRERRDSTVATADQHALAVTPPSVPVVAGLGLAVVVRVIGAPTPLSPLYQEISDNIRSGIVYGRGTDFDAIESALVVPLGPFVGAFAPFGAAAALVVLGITATALVAHLAGRVDADLPIPAIAIAVLAPLLWAQQLPAALAATACALAVALLWDQRLDPWRVATAGVVLAAAALSRPEALLALPVLAGWLLLRRHGWRALLFVAVAVGTVLPWQLWVQRNFDTWLPTTSVGAVLSGASDSSARGGANIGSWAPRPVATPGSEATMQAEQIEEFGDRALRHFQPQIMGSRILRTWDLWWPGNAESEREQRDLPYAGGFFGGLVQAAVSALAVWGAVVHRARWRELFPLYALPIAASFGAALTFGDRAFGAYAAVPLVLLAALGARSAVDLWRRSGFRLPEWRGVRIPR